MSKMYGYFDGDFRTTRPQQNLGGASRKLQKQQLLDRAANERKQREDLRRKMYSATFIQSWVRGYLVRKRENCKFRQEFDNIMNKIAKEGQTSSLGSTEFLVQRLIIFYSKKEDNQRLIWLCQHLIKQVKDITIAIKVKYEINMWLYRIKCIINLSISYLSTASQQTPIATPMRILELFTSVNAYTTDSNIEYSNQILVSIWSYLISCGYFRQMRNLINSKVPEPYESTVKPPTLFAATLLDLILRPFKDIHHHNEDTLNLFIIRFFLDLLNQPFTPQIKFFLITSICHEIPPYLKANFIINALLRQNGDILLTIPVNIWLFYSTVKLVGIQTINMNTQEILKYLHILRCLSASLSDVVKTQNAVELHTDLDVDDNETMDIETDSHESNSVVDPTLVQEIIAVINEPIHVQAVIGLIDIYNTEDAEFIISLSCLCHSLLACHQLAVNQYRLLYSLAFKSSFLRMLWKYITSISTPSVFGSPTSLLYILSRGLPLAAVKWNQILPQLTLFCALFSYLLQTLDDVEFYHNVDTDIFDQKSTHKLQTMPFTLQELASLGLTLRDVCIGLVELAYHDTRPTIKPNYHIALKIVNENSTDDQKNEMQNWNKLFKSCVKLLRQLYARDSRRQFCPLNHWISKHVAIPVERPTNFRQGIQQRRMYREFLGLRHLSREELEEHGPPLSVNEVRNVTILQEIPFVVSFVDRVKIFQNHLTVDKTRQRGDANSFNILGPSIQVVIRRNYIYEDAFEKLSPENEPNLNQSLRVQLVNVVGLDEAGIDGGGIFREFLNELLKTAFDPNRGFFKSTSDSLLYPNPSVSILVDNYLKHYYFIGRMLAKGIYDNMLVELPFAPFFLAKLLARHSASDIEIHHLASLDPVMYKNLMFLKNYDGDVSELGLDFTVLNSELGTTQTVELKAGGSNIAVTAQNRIEYIHLMADYRLNKQIRNQCNAFKQGIADVLELDWLRMFDPRELQILISGAQVPIDIDDLRRHTNYAGGYSDEHSVILIFWKVFSLFSEQEKRKMLKFVTSCSRPPLLGFKELYPVFCIQNAGREPNRLPTASTCMNLLKLPEFQDEETMKQKLLYAINSAAGFELS